METYKLYASKKSTGRKETQQKLVNVNDNNNDNNNDKLAKLEREVLQQKIEELKHEIYLLKGALGEAELKIQDLKIYI